MPPFVSTECPHCNQSNRFDLAELQKTNTMVIKSLVLYRPVEENEEFSVTCQHCGRKFKFSVKGGNYGEEE